MSDGELLWFVAGLVIGFVLVGTLILINARMKANERRALGLSTRLLRKGHFKPCRRAN